MDIQPVAFESDEEPASAAAAAPPWPVLATLAERLAAVTLAVPAEAVAAFRGALE